MNNIITLNHGDGGKYTSELINNLYYKYFNNEILNNSLDSAIIDIKGKLAFTTDSFVVQPIFFSGGNIGQLAVYGTVNDLTVSGAKPLYISCSFIIEEGFEFDKFHQIVQSMGEASRQAGVKIVTGDTKVVEKGSVDGVFVNTSGIGIVEEYSEKSIQVGDKVIITGSIAEHGTTIAIERYRLDIKGEFKSDCYPVNKIMESISKYKKHIKIMKDPTRGGIATALNEISTYEGIRIRLLEDRIPIREEVKYVNNMIGLDPLYMACEGRILMIVEEGTEDEIINTLKTNSNSIDANTIGIVESKANGMVYMGTCMGGKRILNVLDSPMLPRIC